MSPIIPSPARPRILVIDDDADVVRALRFMSETRGYDVVGCRSAAEGLLAADRSFACLIIDQNLSDLRGMDLLETLRRRGVDTPAVIITTSPSAALSRQAEAASVPIVEKPLLDETLFTQIDRLHRIV